MHVTREWMFSLRRMRMNMSGNKIGSDNASDAEILNIPNTNAMMPPNLRVVPQHMEMDMTMLGVMYAPNTDLTLMAMRVRSVFGAYITPSIVISISIC